MSGQYSVASTQKIKPQIKRPFNAKNAEIAENQVKNQNQNLD